MNNGSEHSGKTYFGYGCGSYGDAVNGVGGPGRSFWSSWQGYYPKSRFCIRTLTFAKPPKFKVGTVCVSSASTGSVRGVLGNRHPYRDRPGFQPGPSEYESSRWE